MEGNKMRHLQQRNVKWVQIISFEIGCDFLETHIIYMILDLCGKYCEKIAINSIKLIWCHFLEKNEV